MFIIFNIYYFTIVRSIVTNPRNAKDLSPNIWYAFKIVTEMFQIDILLLILLIYSQPQRLNGILIIIVTNFVFHKLIIDFKNKWKVFRHKIVFLFVQTSKNRWFDLHLFTYYSIDIRHIIIMYSFFKNGLNKMTTYEVSIFTGNVKWLRFRQ